jgi:hypothetical protein
VEGWVQRKIGCGGWLVTAADVGGRGSGQAGAWAAILVEKGAQVRRSAPIRRGSAVGFLRKSSEGVTASRLYTKFPRAYATACSTPCHVPSLLGLVHGEALGDSLNALVPNYSRASLSSLLLSTSSFGSNGPIRLLSITLKASKLDG